MKTDIETEDNAAERSSGSINIKLLRDHMLLAYPQIVDQMRECRLCPRNCGANRWEGRKGFCRMGALPEAARASLHMWEEPCISGTFGSGTVFFSGCNLGCIYCQNHEIAQGEHGFAVSIERLAEIFLEQEERGAANINLVTACHFIPQTAAALQLARNEGLDIPVVYNSSGYEKVSSLRMLEGLVDIYLPDFKYCDEELARKYSHAEDYPAVAEAALEEMFRQVGEPEFDGNGMMRKGMIVRHLLLPGHVAASKRVVQYLYGTYGNRIYISLMSQYTPIPAMKDDPLLSRKVTKREYRRLVNFALELGLENGFTQDGEAAAESFIPSFNGEGIL